MDANVIVINQNPEKKIKKTRGRPKGALNKKIKGAKPCKEQQFRVQKSYSDKVLAKDPIENSLLKQIEKEILNKKPQEEIAEKAIIDARGEVENFMDIDPIVQKKSYDEQKLINSKTKFEKKILKKKQRLLINKGN